MVMFVEDEKTLSSSVEPVQVESIVEYVPVADIKIDMRYQRRLSLKKVAEIAADFDPAIAGVLVLSLRSDGCFYVVDGQHRAAAMRKLGIEKAKCEVIIGLTLREEADKFVKANKTRKSPESLDVHKALTVKGDPVTLEINAIVERCGLSIQADGRGARGKRKPGVVWAVAALNDIYQRGKADLLEYILKLVMEAWPGDWDVLDQKVLLGVMTFHLKYQGRYRRDDFIEKMKIVSLRSLRQRAQYHSENGGGGLSKTFCKALQEQYDWHRRTKRLEPATN